MELERILHYAKLSPIGVLRYSGSYLIRPESTPDHISTCTTLAVMIIKDLRNLGIEVDKEKLIYKIAIHDLPESITSDVIRPLKYHHPELTREFRIAEEDMIRKAGFPEDLISDINDAKDETLEGRLMAFIDILQVVTKLYEEVFELGNKLLKKEYNSAINTFERMILEVKASYPETSEYFNNLLNIFKNNVII